MHTICQDSELVQANLYILCDTVLSAMALTEKKALINHIYHYK